MAAPIGNLTLTTLNSEMGNKSFAEKREYFSKSGLKLNKYFIELNARLWNGGRIAERAEYLFKSMKKIWEDIPTHCRKTEEPEDLPLISLDVEEFLGGDAGQSSKPRKISHVMFGDEEISDIKYAVQRRWKNNESELEPTKTPEGRFYDAILKRVYAEHPGSFENTSLGQKVGLVVMDDKLTFIVPFKTIEHKGSFAVQPEYDKIWSNIKLAAEETGTLEKLRIRFAK